MPRDHAHRLEACLGRAYADVEPASPDQIDQAIVLLSGLQISAKQGVTAAALENAYLVGLDDIPADLLARAVREALKTSTFRPMPAELRKMVQDELDARHRRLNRLKASASLR